MLLNILLYLSIFKVCGIFVILTKSYNYVYVTQNSQEKKVSFGLPVIEEVPEESAPEPEAAEDCDVTVSSQLDVSTASHENDSFSRMKDRILKKYSLDLSPDFVYEKVVLDLPTYFSITAITSQFSVIPTYYVKGFINSIQLSIWYLNYLWNYVTKRQHFLNLCSPE